jgi:hypothetical protein
MNQHQRFIERTAAAAALIDGLLYRERDSSAAGALATEPPCAEDGDGYDGADPSYAGGIVVAIHGARIVLEVAGIPRVVQMTDETIVWREFPLAPDAIELGDWLDVRGVPCADGTLLARSGMVLVNVGFADGTVTDVDDRAITLEHGDRRTSFAFSDHLQVVSMIDGLPRCEHLRALAPGMLADVIGLVLPDGSLRATRITC